jgi:hypothetical protein
MLYNFMSRSRRSGNKMMRLLALWITTITTNELQLPFIFWPKARILYCHAHLINSVIL